jgi:hypothetical protein
METLITITLYHSKVKIVLPPLPPLHQNRKNTESLFVSVEGSPVQWYNSDSIELRRTP